MLPNGPVAPDYGKEHRGSAPDHPCNLEKPFTISELVSLICRQAPLSSIMRDVFLNQVECAWQWASCWGIKNTNFPPQRVHILTHSRYFLSIIIEQWSYHWQKVLQGITMTITDSLCFGAPNWSQTPYMNYFCNLSSQSFGADTIIKWELQKIQLLTKIHTDGKS